MCQFVNGRDEEYCLITQKALKDAVENTQHKTELVSEHDFQDISKT